MGLGGLEKEIGIYRKGLLNSDYKGMEKNRNLVFIRL